MGPAFLFAATISAMALGVLPAPVRAQIADGALPMTIGANPAAPIMTPDEARAILAEQLAADAALEARIALLSRQRLAAGLLGDRVATLRTLGQLVALTKGRPAWGGWMDALAAAEFLFGNQQRAIELGEELIAWPDISPELRARATSRLAYVYFNVNERDKANRAYAAAERAYAALPGGTTPGWREYLLTNLLKAKSEMLRVGGDYEASTTAARESLLAGRRYQAIVLAAAGGDRGSSGYRAAVAEVDYATGPLVYALARQGRTAEAVAVAQEGLARAQLDRLGPDSLGGWHHRLAIAYLPQRRYGDALREARASIDELERAGTLPTGQQISLARNIEVISLIGLQRWSEADATYARYLDSVKGDRPAYDRAYDVRLVALLAAKNNRSDAGLQLIETSYRFRVRLYGARHPLTVEARGVRGTIHLINGAVSAALADYDELFSALLDTSSGWVDLDPSGRRGPFLQIALDEFLRYAAQRYRSGGEAALDRRIVDRVVQVTDRLGTGAVHQSIVDSTARVLAGKPELNELLGREQESRNQLREQYRAITEALLKDNKDATDEQRKQAREELRKLRDEAEASTRLQGELRAAIARRFPEYVDLVSPVSPAPEALRKVLARGEVFVTIYPTSYATFVWAVGANGERALHVSPWTERDLDARAAAMRATLDIGSAPDGRAPPFDFAVAHEIYRELLGPIQPALRGANSMVVASHGALAAVPLASLLTAPSQDLGRAAWLVRDMSVAQVPNAAGFAALRRAEVSAGAALPMIGFGDPLFDPGRAAGSSGKVRNLVGSRNASRVATYTVEQGFQYGEIPPLPETRDELLAIAAALGANPQRDLVLGAQATRKAVLGADLSNRRVVAFATHGLLPGDIPGLSKPALAMAGVPAGGAADPPESPLLILDDILTLKLNAQWVVLSACNTAGGERDGAAMSGLVRGFFFAGTRSVLATHWAVDSEASRALVTQVFSDYAKNPARGRAASLREAQLAMIDGKLGPAAYAHPFYWAPYALFGDPLR